MESPILVRRCLKMGWLQSHARKNCPYEQGNLGEQVYRGQPSCSTSRCSFKKERQMGSKKYIPPARRRREEGLGTSKEQNPGMDRSDPKTRDVVVGESHKWAAWPWASCCGGGSEGHLPTICIEP